jgi:CHASE3 domain sensor protein
MDDAGQDHRDRRQGLTGVTVAASSLLALLLGGGFALLLWAITDADDSVSARRASRSALVQAGAMELLLVDLETGQRGYLITRREEFLRPWTRARAELPRETRRFMENTTSRVQRRAAERIAAGVRSFLDDYSVPLVDAVRRGEPVSVDLARTAEGKERVDTLRALFDQYIDDERAQLARRTDAAGANSHQAVLARPRPRRVDRAGDGLHGAPASGGGAARAGGGGRGAGAGRR